MPLRIPTITDLDSSQRAVVQHIPYNDAMFVKGPPGSGKTHIAILRLNVLLSEGYSNILFLLYNHSMYGFLNNIFGKMGLKETVEINTKDKYFYDLAIQKNYSRSNENSYDDYEIIYDKRLKYIENLSSMPSYDVIVIDECQDFSLRELKLLERMSTKIIAVGDVEQSVYRKNSASFYSKLKTHELSTIYRYGKQVAAVAEHFSIQGNYLKSKVTNANKSDVYKVKIKGRSELISTIAKIVKSKQTTDISIGILSLTSNQLSALQKELQNAGIPVFYCQNNQNIRNHNFESREPILITPHSAKGMEFDCVILVGYNNLLNWGNFNDVRKELIYVSLTRTCNELYLMEEQDTVKELCNLSEWRELSVTDNIARTKYEF